MHNFCSDTGQGHLKQQQGNTRKPKMDSASQVAQQDSPREDETAHGEPELPAAGDVPPEAAKNGARQRAPADSSGCGEQQTVGLGARSQLNTQGADDVGSKTHNGTLHDRDTSNHSEVKHLSHAETDQTEATCSKTESFVQTVEQKLVEANCVKMEQSSLGTERSSNVHRNNSGELSSVLSGEHVHETGLTHQKDKTEDGAEDSDESSVLQNSSDHNSELQIHPEDSDESSVENSSDHNDELQIHQNGQSDDGPAEDSGTERSDTNDGNGEADADANVADGPHALSGPDRRRQTARHQRRREAGGVAPQQQSRRISLPQDLMAQWRAIGAQWGLQDDDDIAQVLLRNYEDAVAGRPPRPPPRPRCQGCGEVLVPMPCNACGPNQHSQRLSHDRGHGGSRNDGRNGFCGRCRD